MWQKSITTILILCFIPIETLKENDIYQIDVEFHSCTWHHRPMWQCPNGHLCSGNRLIPGTQEAQELASFGDDHISRARMDCWETVKHAQEIDIQPSAINSKVYKVDKWTNWTDNYPSSGSFSLLWRRYLPSLCLLKCHHIKAFFDHSSPSLNSLLPSPASFFRGLMTTGYIIYTIVTWQFPPTKM